MANRKIRYVGPLAEVRVSLPDGREVRVAQNHQAELPEEVAKGLNQQPIWEYVKEESKSKDKQDEKPAGE